MGSTEMDKAIEAACRGYYAVAGINWDNLSGHVKSGALERMRAAIAAYHEAGGTVAVPVEWLEKLDIWMDEGCNRLAHGRCRTRACLIRGGWSTNIVAGEDIATCPKYEIAQMFAARSEGGTVAVPVEPTYEMIDAGSKATLLLSPSDVAATYKAMLAARPEGDG
jgi:hypothetical protein